MPDWTPKPTIVIGGVEFRLQYPNLYPDKFMYVEFQPIDRGYKCVLAPSTSLLKLLDGTWERELRAFAKRMFDDLRGRTIATDCLCDAYSEELETILNNYKEEA